jgi:Clostripain family
MKRRKILQYGALSSASFLVNQNWLNSTHVKADLPKSMREKNSYEWLVLYWMPYDNNLSGFGIPILEMLTRGVQSDNILVVVESDFSGAKQLSRHIIAKGKINQQQIETSNSASEEIFAEYLNWAKSQFQAEKWAIVFLGHGGRLDELSPDEHPEPGSFSVTKWMNIYKLSQIISNFNKELDNRVELVFFQNCNKGTIEAHYTFKDTAKYTLSSQLVLGAPNYYYESLFEFLGRHPEINGGQLAEKIMEFERSDMYHSYTVINNFAMRDLPAKINPVIEEILSSNTDNIKIGEIKTYNYMGDRFVDAVAFFEAIANQSDANKQKCQDFVDFVKKSMIHKFYPNLARLQREPDYKNFSGLGIFLPGNRQALEQYRYLPVFSDLKLSEMFDKIIFN